MAQFREIVTKKGIKYRAIVRVKGFSQRSKTFKKKTEAREWAYELETLMKKGAYAQISISAKNAVTICKMSELIDYFKENEAPTRYTDYKKYIVMYEWWKERIGNVLVSDVTSAMLSQCKEIIANEKPIKKYNNCKKRGSNTINKYLMALSAILTYAVKDLELIKVNPMSNVKKKKKPKGRTRFLSKDEIRLLCNACSVHSQKLYLFVIIALSSGARYSEILNLKVENIDFKNKMYHFLNTKNGENRGVPANERVLNITKDYLKNKQISTGYIFLNDKKTKLAFMRGPFANIVKQIGLEDFHFHDLRHTTASYTAMNGGSLLDIAEILGHKSLVMARRYSHLTQKHTSSILNKVNESILDI